MASPNLSTATLSAQTRTMVSSCLPQLLEPWGALLSPLCPGKGALDTGTGIVWAMVLSPVVVKLQGLGLASIHGEVRDPRRARVGTQGWAECVGTEQRGEDRRKWDGENFCDYEMEFCKLFSPNPCFRERG